MAGHKRLVAVLDDDERFAELVDVVLGDEGYRVAHLDAGLEDPVRAVRRTKPDLLMLDLHGVGEEGGLELLKRLRGDAAHAGLPILVCSGDVQQLRQHATELSRMPRLTMLEKPFGIHVLVGTVEGLLRGATTFPEEGGVPDARATAELQAFCERLGKSLRWAVVDAWVPDRRPGLLRCAATWVAAIQLEPFAEVSRRTRLPVGSGLPGRAWVSRRAAWIEDVTADLNFPRKAAARRVRLVSALAVPIVDGDEVVGVVAGYDTRHRRPDPGVLDRFRRSVAGAAPMMRAAAGRA